jgi:hypothetical protein
MVVEAVGKAMNSKAPGGRTTAPATARREPGSLDCLLWGGRVFSLGFYFGYLRSLIGGIQGSGWKVKYHSLFLYWMTYLWNVLVYF